MHAGGREHITHPVTDGGTGEGVGGDHVTKQFTAYTSASHFPGYLDMSLLLALQ